MPIPEAQLDPTQYSLNFFLQNFLLYLNSREKTLKKTVSKTKTVTSPYDTTNHIRSYTNYKRNVNNRLREINDNVSNIITESCSKIDELCNKVRECLMDVQYSYAESYLEATKSRYSVDGSAM